jgi:hypothetical protein
MELIEQQSCKKVAVKYRCESCDYFTCRKSSFDKHISTGKHKNSIKSDLGDSKVAKSCIYICTYCDKIYGSKNGLWKHKKVCSAKEEPMVLDMSQNIIFELLKQNNEFKELLVEQNKQMIEKNTENQKLQQQLIEITSKVGGNTNCNNNNNNTFNLQFFLNEQCKDALNIDEFVNQIQLQLSDLDMIGRLGYTEGMSKIIIRNLREMDIFKRPIHCSDLKRETMYIKDKDAWEKENGENVKIKKVIKCIEHKNIKQIPQWVEENPTSEDTDTKKHMEYKNIVLEAMGGSTSEDDNKKREKIIRNIAKEVVIDKKGLNNKTE